MLNAQTEVEPPASGPIGGKPVEIEETDEVVSDPVEDLSGEVFTLGGMQLLLPMPLIQSLVVPKGALQDFGVEQGSGDNDQTAPLGEFPASGVVKEKGPADVSVGLPDLAADSAGTFSTLVDAGLPILTALFPIPMAQLRVQTQAPSLFAPVRNPAAVRIENISASIGAPGPILPDSVVTMPMAPRLAAVPATPAPLLAAPASPVTAAEKLGAEVVLGDAPVAVNTQFPRAAENRGGTTAAKREGVMQFAPSQLPEKSRQKASAGEFVTSDSAAPRARFNPEGANLFPSVHEPGLSTLPLAASGENGERESAGRETNPESRFEIQSAPPIPLHSSRAEFDPLTSEIGSGANPLKPESPITRAEMVHTVERTTEAAVRMRTIGTERVEVAVKLESGDTLTIQLRLANGEVTPTIQTSSEGLRTAIEQNWAQFSDRSADRGVRMTPPVFDANQSSSNMADLSQQRHGRDSAYPEAQPELFPNLPRRMPPQRVLAPGPIETAAAADRVRLYA
jgi:hypothetical protein